MKKPALLLTFLLLSAVQCFAQFETIWEKKMPGLAQIGDVKFSHNSQIILCYVPYQGIHLYNAGNGELIKDLPEIYQPVFSLDDSHIYGIIGNHIAYLNIQTGVDESKLQDADTNLVTSIISKDEMYYIGLTHNELLVWDVQTGQIIKRKQLVFGEPTMNFTDFTTLSITCDNSKLYISSYDRLFDHKTPQGEIVYKYDRFLNEYNFNTLDSIKCLYSTKTGDNKPVLGKIYFSNDCSLLAFQFAGFNPPDITINHFPSMERKFSIPDAWPIKFTSDDKYLVTASAYKNLLALYKVETGELLKQRLEGSVQTLDITNENSLIVVSIAGLLRMKRFPITSIPADPLKKEIKVYPNPAFDNVNLEIDLGQASQVVVVIRDTTANSEFLLDQYLEEGFHVLNLNLLPYSQGAYTLEINIDGSSYNLPITIAR